MTPDTAPPRPPDAADLVAVMEAALAQANPLETDGGETVPALQHVVWHEREVLHFHELHDQSGRVTWWTALRRRQGTIDHLLHALTRFAMEEVTRGERALLPPRQFHRAARDRFTRAWAQADTLLPARRGRLKLPEWWGRQRRFETQLALSLAAYADALLALNTHLGEALGSAEASQTIRWHADECAVTPCHPWSRFNHYARVTVAESLPMLSTLSTLRLERSA